MKLKGIAMVVDRVDSDGNLITKEAMEKGIIAGFPLVDMSVELYDGSFHDVDSSESAFKIAASMALQEAAKGAKPVLLEPIMKVEVVTPDQFLGDVTGILNSKRGQIENITDRINLKVIDSKVPLSDMFGFVTVLRSLTEGRASFSMEFDHYARVSENVAELIKEGKK